MIKIKILAPNPAKLNFFWGKNGVKKEKQCLKRGKMQFKKIGVKKEKNV